MFSRNFYIYFSLSTIGLSYDIAAPFRSLECAATHKVCSAVNVNYNNCKDRSEACIMFCRFRPKYDFARIGEAGSYEG